MSELARRRKSGATKALACFCDACDRVLYVPQDELFCPVCSSALIPTDDVEVVSVEVPSTT